MGPLNKSALYAPPNHAICLPVNGSLRGGFCAFGSGLRGSGEGDSGGRPYVTADMVKEGLGVLMKKGCRMCGSVPLPGEQGGWLTVNYISGDVCPGICPEARYE